MTFYTILSNFSTDSWAEAVKQSYAMGLNPDAIEIWEDEEEKAVSKEREDYYEYMTEMQNHM